ncbi:MAG: hypothetical protein V4678_01455 [Patescibacteria group bacterium]
MLISSGPCGKEHLAAVLVAGLLGEARLPPVQRHRSLAGQPKPRSGAEADVAEVDQHADSAAHLRAAPLVRTAKLGGSPVERHALVGCVVLAVSPDGALFLAVQDCEYDRHGVGDSAVRVMERRS